MIQHPKMTRKKREIKSLVPDYNSDQSSYVDSKSNLSTEELRKDDNLNEEECSESIEQKDKSEISTKSSVIVSHEPSAETVSDVPQHAILIPSDKPSDDHDRDHPEKTIVIPSDELSSDKPSEDHDGDHPENTIVIPSDEPSEDDEESENGLLSNEQVMNCRW